MPVTLVMLSCAAFMLLIGLCMMRVRCLSRTDEIRRPVAPTVPFNPHQIVIAVPVVGVPDPHVRVVEGRRTREN